MRKKLKSKAGVTLVELMAAVAILLLLGLILLAGLNFSFTSYRTATAQSELELLLSTAVDALVDDLRYARNVDPTASPVTYFSDSYGEGTHFTITNPACPNQLVAESSEGPEPGRDYWRVLPTGAYGLNKAYRITELGVTYDDGTFNIQMKVETADGSISASTPEDGVAVRCLYPI